MLKPQDILLVLKILSAGRSKSRSSYSASTWRVAESESKSKSLSRTHSVSESTSGTRSGSVAGAASLSYAHLAKALGISPSQVHAAAARAMEAGLMDKGMCVRRNASLEFLVHGVKYIFPPKIGGMTRGTPTSHAAPPLAIHIVADGEPPPVWPDPKGEVRGTSFEPIYKTAPLAARMDAELYEYLALLDALRSGRAREARLAEDLLRLKMDLDP